MPLTWPFFAFREKQNGLGHLSWIVTVVLNLIPSEVRVSRMGKSGKRWEETGPESKGLGLSLPYGYVPKRLWHFVGMDSFAQGR